MHHGTILRSLSYDTKFGAIHLKAQYYAVTGFFFPVEIKPQHRRSRESHAQRRNSRSPPYICYRPRYRLQRREKLFISEYIGPGFYGVNFMPFMIRAVSGPLHLERSRRHENRPSRPPRSLPPLILRRRRPNLQNSSKAQDYMKVMQAAREMMDSPIKKSIRPA